MSGLIQYLCYVFGNTLANPPARLFGMMHTTPKTSVARAIRLQDQLIAAMCLDSVSEDYREIFDTGAVMDALCAELSNLKSETEAVA